VVTGNIFYDLVPEYSAAKVLSENVLVSFVQSLFIDQHTAQLMSNMNLTVVCNDNTNASRSSNLREDERSCRLWQRNF